MEKMIKMRQDIQNSTEEMHSSVKNLYDWEKEMKEKEKKLLQEGETTEEIVMPPIRTLIENNKNEKPSNTNPVLMKEAHKIENNCLTEETTAKQKADVSKEKGNNFVKLGKYQEAIYFYTDAINHFDNDPVFYSNRALCYLKLKKYNECIEDCNNAIKKDEKTLKAYYRRMQANENLGEIEKCLKDCQIILQYDKKNIETKNSVERLNKKLQKSQNIVICSKPTFTQATLNIKEINAINKPAHLRSKKTLKKILVHETITLKNDKTMENQISDEVIDKLFNNNDVGNYTEVKKSNKIQDKTPIEDFNVENAILNKENDQLEVEKLELFSEIKSEKKIIKQPEEIRINTVTQQKNKIISIPVSSTQFHITWKELSDQQRFMYLKSIKLSNLNKVLGPGLEPDTITDIFKILKEFYINENLEIIDILLEISKHDEFNILSMLLSEDDRKILDEFIKYMKGRKNNSSIIEEIEKKYYYQSSYD